MGRRPNVVCDAPARRDRYSGLSVISTGVAFWACSRVTRPALSMSWSRSRTDIEREAFAALRIVSAAGVDFGLIFFGVSRLLDRVDEPASHTILIKIEPDF